jgi:hypothetical protein
MEPSSRFAIQVEILPCRPNGTQSLDMRPVTVTVGPTGPFAKYIAAQTAKKTVMHHPIMKVHFGSESRFFRCTSVLQHCVERLPCSGRVLQRIVIRRFQRRNKKAPADHHELPLLLPQKIPLHKEAQSRHLARTR